jgi:hypothetical protein
VAVIFLFFLLFAVEIPRPVRTSNDAVFASDASPEILNYDSVFATKCRFGRTDRHAWSMIAVHTGHGNDLRVYMRIFPIGYCNHLVPIKIFF